MDFNEYQKLALKTDTYAMGGKKVEVSDLAFINKVLGLVGESGEVAEKIKKIMRNHDGKMNEEQRIELGKELGDVLWYLSALSAYTGFSLEQIAKDNLAKLADRAERNVIKSQGDNR